MSKEGENEDWPRVGRLCISVVRAFDRQSKDLMGSNPSAVESVIFPKKDFKQINIFHKYPGSNQLSYWYSVLY